MNWAMEDRESRLFKGKNLYRWDISPGLGMDTVILDVDLVDLFTEHHCGVCATPLHSRCSIVISRMNPLTVIDARAKTTCLGKHVEPCFRFHQQLHFKGKLPQEPRYPLRSYSIYSKWSSESKGLTTLSKEIAC